MMKTKREKELLRQFKKSYGIFSPTQYAADKEKIEQADIKSPDTLNDLKKNFISFYYTKDGIMPVNVIMPSLSQMRRASAKDEDNWPYGQIGLCVLTFDYDEVSHFNYGQLVEFGQKAYEKKVRSFYLK